MTPQEQAYHSALSQCAELLDNMKDGDPITMTPVFLAAKLMQMKSAGAARQGGHGDKEAAIFPPLTVPAVLTATERYADILCIQRAEAETGDPYMLGLYNGMLMMCANFDNTEYEPMSKSAVPVQTAEVPQGFTDYMKANYSGVVDVYDAEWHARRLWNAAMRHLAAPVQAEQAQAEPIVFDDFPEFNAHAMGCGLEDRGITDRYDAMRYGFEEALDLVDERIKNFLADLAVPTQAEQAAAVRRAALEDAAKLIEKKVGAYDQEHGSYDHTTGVTEYPGNGGEWICEMEELAEEIRALAAPSTASSTTTGALGEKGANK